MMLINRSKYKTYLIYFEDLRYLISKQQALIPIISITIVIMLLLCEKFDVKNLNQITIDQDEDCMPFDAIQKNFI